MPYYRVVLRCGHVGPKNSYEVVRYMEAKDLDQLLSSVKKISRLKHRSNPLRSLVSVEPVSRRDFFLYRNRIKDDPYLSRGGRW